jgi:hypothetical protein
MTTFNQIKYENNTFDCSWKALNYFVDDAVSADSAVRIYKISWSVIFTVQKKVKCLQGSETCIVLHGLPDRKGN